MDGIKQAILANTWIAMKSAIKNAESVPIPELGVFRDMLEPMVGSGQS